MIQADLILRHVYRLTATCFYFTGPTRWQHESARLSCETNQLVKFVQQQWILQTCTCTHRKIKITVFIIFSKKLEIKLRTVVGSTMTVGIYNIVWSYFSVTGPKSVLGLSWHRQQFTARFNSSCRTSAMSVYLRRRSVTSAGTTVFVSRRQVGVQSTVSVGAAEYQIDERVTELLASCQIEEKVASVVGQTYLQKTCDYDEDNVLLQRDTTSQYWVKVINTDNHIL